MTSSINASTSGGGGVITTADSSGILAIQTGGTTAVTIDGSQNVGIGTSSPATKLSVSGAGNFTSTLDVVTNTAAAYGLRIIADSANTYAGIQFTNNPVTTGLGYYRMPSASTHQWLNSSAVEQMRITSTGAVAFNGASNYGTAGQVLSSNGDAPPTWTTVSAPVDVQTFDSTAAWTKPTAGQTMARIQVWGGGGGGSRGNAGAAAGGGGGGYNEVTVPLSFINSQTVTVGAAGVGRTGSTGVGTAGGTSSVVLATAWNGVTTIAAYGGGGGSTGAIGGSGGGPLSAGSVGGGNYTLPGAPYITTYSYDACTSVGYVMGGSRGATGLGGIWHGGAGSISGYPAGGSIYAGGGGAVGSSGYLARGQSVWGGNGGANAVGATPAGGGGCSASANVNGSNGGGGRVTITCW
jgi:hypothetical protein